MAILALLVCGALAFDCDSLHEPERTRCLDRAADQNVQMAPVADDEPQVAVQPVHSFIEDDDDTDDIMGDLGEAASSRVSEQVATTAKAKAQQELKMAAASTEGLYDEDVHVMKAFSDLTDSVSQMSTCISRSNIILSHKYLPAAI